MWGNGITESRVKWTIYFVLWHISAKLNLTTFKKFMWYTARIYNRHYQQTRDTTILHWAMGQINSWIFCERISYQLHVRTSVIYTKYYVIIERSNQGNPLFTNTAFDIEDIYIYVFIFIIRYQLWPYKPASINWDHDMDNKLHPQLSVGLDYSSILQ